MMATRCQVKITQRDMPIGIDPSITLYHHFDGYPDNMIPLFKMAKGLIKEKWEGGRVGKVAGYLCAADPGQFEAESTHQLRGDIEWYYEIDIVNIIGDDPKWLLRVTDINSGEKSRFYKLDDCGFFDKEIDPFDRIVGLK